MTDKRKSQVTLKRRVNIKAIVTEQFKQYLNLELNEAVRMASLRLSEIGSQLEDEKFSNLRPQLLAEKNQHTLTIENEAAQKKMIDELAIDSVFNQGAIDGFVAVSEGDNLYEKLGGMEILVKDGIVQKITHVGRPQI